MGYGFGCAIFTNLPHQMSKNHFFFSACDPVDVGTRFQIVAGALQQISAGHASVWGHYVNVYCLLNTFADSDNIGSTWTLVSGLKVSHISSGKNIVWGSNPSHVVYYRTGINESNPCGSGWKVDADNTIRAASLSVSSRNNRAWLITPNDEIFRRIGVTVTNPVGIGWTQVAGSLVTVTVGDAGVWGIDSLGDIMYRMGTSINDGGDEEGYGWKKVSGSLTTISSGNAIVWGTDSENQVYYRAGICYGNPTGNSWGVLQGSVLKQISVDTLNNAVWGVQANEMGYKIYKRM